MKRGRPRIFTDEERKKRRRTRQKGIYLDKTTVSKANVRNLAATMVDRAKAKQAKLGLPWDERITVELVIEMTLERWSCADTNEPFHDLRFPGCHPSRPWAPSLDRIDSSIGYTLDGPGKYGNLQVVCAFVNRAKSNLPNRVAKSFLKVAP